MMLNSVSINNGSVSRCYTIECDLEKIIYYDKNNFFVGVSENFINKYF